RSYRLARTHCPRSTHATSLHMRKARCMSRVAAWLRRRRQGPLGGGRLAGACAMMPRGRAHELVLTGLPVHIGVRREVFFHTAATSPRLRRFVTLPVDSATRLLARHGLPRPAAPLRRRPDIAGREIARGDHAHFLRVGIRVLKAYRTAAALSAERGMSLLPSDGPPALQQGGPPALVRARARLFAHAVRGLSLRSPLQCQNEVPRLGDTRHVRSAPE